MTPNRREFLKRASAAGLGLVVSRRATPAWGSRWPSDKVVVAVMGTNSRGAVLARECARTPNVEVAYVCDVETGARDKGLAAVGEVQAKAPQGVVDFRRALDDANVDALVIAAPDHWHAPAAILALSAGKHVYVEKPCGHNSHEGELLVAAQRKSGRLVQQGTQQRSHPASIEVVQAIREGLIGRPYLARAWYANTRTGIGRGKEAPVPAGLDYELWQGPAPRTPYRDNVIPYNWHWFWRWGTGEICNNGTHELDVARWALGVDYPVSASSSGGRYHFDDDWEFPDTQEATFEFPNGASVIWQGQSCNGAKTYGRSRGTAVLGTQGSVVMDRDGYVVYDLKGEVMKQSVVEQGSGLDVRGDDPMTQLHLANLADAIRTGARLHAPIEDGVKSVLLCHLGNIAQKTGRRLSLDPATGRITGDADAMRMWQREYAPGWAPRA